MPKLKLDLEQLTVESFDACRNVQDVRGTVEGRVENQEPIGSEDIICVSIGCFNSYIYGSCNVTCGSTCLGATCHTCSCPDNETCGYTCHYPAC